MCSCVLNLTKNTLSKFKSTILFYFCYRNLILFRTGKIDYYDDIELKCGDFELLKAKSISDCDFLEESNEKNIVISELKKGSLVYLLHKNKLVSAYACLATSKINIGEVSAKIEIENNEAYIYNCFTIPGCRGHGLYTKLLKLIINDNIDSLVYIASLKSNKKSIYVIEKVNFLYFDKIRYVKLFGISKLFFNFQRKIGK